MRKSIEYQAKRHRTNFTWIWNYLLEHPCSVCGEKDPVVLEFHHPEDNKTGTVAMMMWNRGLDKLQAEVAKCVIVCANCHKRLHNGRVSHAERYGLVIPAGAVKGDPMFHKRRLPKLMIRMSRKRDKALMNKLLSQSEPTRQQVIAEEVKAWMTADKFGTD